jgi:UDP-N-acetylglucosamine 2-epimerase (non-hydrolysing)
MTLKVCLVSGSRAEWGLLTGLARELAADPAFALQIAVTGSHLDPRFGGTAEEIRGQGFAIDAEAPLSLPDDGRLAIASATGSALSGLAKAYARLTPDVIVLLGDRYEIFAAAAAGLLMNIPLAHIHGGEITEGAVDDHLRHAITKMATLHFAAAEPYAKRIIQMGEAPERVFVTGAPGVDAALSLQMLDRETLGRDLGQPLSHPLLLVTYHPVTLRTDDEGPAIDALLEALDETPGARIVITGVNADAGREKIEARLEAFAASRKPRVTLHASLGQARYLSVMKEADAVIGNSSSGIIEAPAMGVPTVDIGNRQGGRLKAPSVISCGESKAAIAKAITQALDPAFRASIQSQTPPYGGGGAAKRMKEILAASGQLLRRPKRFYDLSAPHTSSSTSPSTAPQAMP